MLQPLQQHGGRGDTSDVHAAAGHGLSGSGGALPHGGTIQDAFGGYDISNVVAHTDSAAAEGATAMGADAYATGTSVAFKGAPDLHTAAHEAAHVLQQQAGVSLSGGVGKAGDAYEQHADKVADAVVAGKSAEPILAEMNGGGGGEAVQKKVVQRVETTSPTPHADAALAQVGAGATPTAGTTPETETTAPVITVPQAYDTYCAHIRTTFAAELEQMRAMQAEFKASANAAKAHETVVTVDFEEQKRLQTQLDEKKLALTREEGIRLAALNAMAPYNGDTMEKLYNAAKRLVESHGLKKIKDDADAKLLEGAMLSAMNVLGQIDPDSGSFGRVLYTETIDKVENGRLVAKAEAEGMAPAACAALAVNYRTWARVFFRTEVMTDPACAEILFMRDLGLSGREAGESPETIMKKVFDKKKKELGLEPTATFDQATEEQKLSIYKGMIESAKSTNGGVNGTLVKKDDKGPAAETPAPETRSTATTPTP